MFSRVRNKLAFDPSGLMGSLVLFSFAVIALRRWQADRQVFFLLLAFRDFLLTFLFALRKAAVQKSSHLGSVIAYCSTGFPLLYFSAQTGLADWRTIASQLLSIAGFLIATLAAIELGTQIGVSPATRGSARCSSGIYRWFRHPMYAGYVVAETGVLLANPINAPLFAISLAGYFYRIQFENQICKTSYSKTET